MANPSSSPPGPSRSGDRVSQVAPADKVPGGLRFAALSVDVTPPPGSKLAGYLARGDATAEGTLDPLEATLLRLGDARAGGGTVTWVALDALAVDVALARAIADAVGMASGVPADSIVVCASHTHSGPAGWLRGIPLAAPDPGDPVMRSELVRRIGEAAAGFGEQGTPVRHVLAVGEAEGIGTNRTDPAKPSDRSLGALAMIDARGAIVGLVVDHASHATVLGHENLRWSADWPGAARRSLSTALAGHTTSGERPVVAFLQGAAGDSSPRFVRRGQTPDEVQRIGDLFTAQAGAVLDAERKAADPPVAEGPTVAIRRRNVEVRTRDLPNPVILAQRVAAAEQAWRRTVADSGTGTAEERIARTRHEGALIAARFAEAGLPPSFELPISVVVVGSDAWLHLPVELFSSFAAEIRTASPFRQTRVIGYTDGYFGYVADAEAHRLEVYEALSSPFDPDGARTLVNASIEVLRETHDELVARRNRA
jgi:hypothetical protein